MKAPPARLGSITRVVTLVGVVLFWGITGFSRDSDEQADEADSLAPAWTSTDTKLANHYLRLLQKDPAYGQVLDLLWDLYEKKAQTDLLLQYLDEAASGDQAIAKVIHGHLLRKNGELDAARLRYDEALAIDASLIPPLKALAEIADQQGRSGKALSYYTRLLDQIPIETEDGLVIRLRKAQLHNQQGNREAAVELWNALLAAHASDAQLRGEIVAFLLEAGETETVISLLEESAEESGVRQQLAALNEIVRIHELVGDFDASIDAIDRALSKLHFRSHDYRSFFARKVRLHERFDRLSELEGRLRVAASPVDAPEKALNDLAELFHLTANPQEEEAIVSRIVERVPEDIDAKVRLARIQMRNDRYEAAATTLDSLLETEPNAPLSLIFLRARVALGADNRAEAESVLQSYLEAEVRPSEEVREIIDFARANYLDRLVESLLRDLGKSGVAGSDGVSAPLELARFLKERGRTDQAVETLASYVAGAGESVTERARRLFQQAVALGDLGLLREALASVDEAILLAPEKSEFLSARVTLLIDSDQVEAAVAQLESIRELTDGIDAVTEIDQRIFSLLRGQYQKEIEPPSIDPFSQASGMTTLEQFQRAATAVNQATLRAGNEPLPKELRDYYDAILKTASAEPSLSNRYRAAWWAFKLQNNQECYSQLVKATEEAGGPVLEAERLLLQLAEQNERLTLMVQHLGNLITLDPENAIEYRQRRAELRFELGYEDEAVRELKALAAAPDASLDTLSTLARVYRRQGNQRRQIEVWEQAYRRANLFEKRRVVKQLTTALIEMAQPQEALEAQLDLISRETDIIQRRKQFDAQVTLARKTGDEPGFRTSQPQLDWLIERYRAFAAESPFDHFYPEALARLYAEVGEDELAFEAMKKAYYMSGQDDRLLSPLGDLAEEVDDLNAAIYYTRQQLARGEGEESIENWANLIGMLEKSFRVEEADAVRQRLEGRFGRDPEFLESLVLEYEKQGSIRAQTRVLERLVALRPWDLTSHFRLGLVRRKRGDDEAAKQSFAAVIVGSEPFALPDDRDAMPLPLLRSSTIDSDIRDDPTLIFEPWLLSIESMPYLGGNLQDEMATVLQKPYPEFTEIPQDEPYLRLRAIEELADIHAEMGTADNWLKDWLGEGIPLVTPMVERIWAARFARDRDALAGLLGSLPEPTSHVENLTQAYSYLLTGDQASLTQWTEAQLDESSQSHSRSIYGVLSAYLQLRSGSGDPLLSQEVVFKMLEDLRFSDSLAIHFWSELRKDGNFGAAHQLSLRMIEDGFVTSSALWFQLAHLAGKAGDEQHREDWLEASIAAPGSARRVGRTDFYLTALTERLALLDSDEEREAYLEGLLTKSGELVANGRGSNSDVQRHLLGWIAAKDTDKSIVWLERLIDRNIAGLRPSTKDENQVRYDQGQNWQRMTGVLRYYVDRIPINRGNRRAFVHAVGDEPLALPYDDSVLAEYEAFEIERRLLLLEGATEGERRLHISSLNSSLRSPESRLNLARRLEAFGFYRESMAVYRAEAMREGGDYAPLSGFFEACEKSKLPDPALEILAKLKTREFPTPAGLTSDYIAEQEAKFLRIDHNVELLAKLARPPVTRDGVEIVSRGYLPYQDELVRLLQERDDRASLVALLDSIRTQGDASNEQKLLGARLALESEKFNEARRWLSSINRKEAESQIERQWIETMIDTIEVEGWRDGEGLLAIARDVEGGQTLNLVRNLADALVEVGAKREAVGLLRRSLSRSSQPGSRTAFAMSLIVLQARNGQSWSELEPDLERFFADFAYEPEGSRRFETGPFVRPSGSGVNPPEVVIRSNLAWFLEQLDEAGALNFELAATLADLPQISSSTWLRSLVFGAAKQDFDPFVGEYLDPEILDSATRDSRLEALASAGEAGRLAAAKWVEESRISGRHFFRGAPARQIDFFHRINDRSRLLEIHTELIRESQSDLFHQINLETHYATLATRFRLPDHFEAVGEPELAGALYEAYNGSVVRYDWSHETFLERMVAHLIRQQEFEEAERRLIELSPKIIGVDRRLWVELYDAAGWLDQWESRTRAANFSTGEEKQFEAWRSRLARGGEIRDTVGR